MKFGGTSVADLDRIRNVANRVKKEVDAGNQVSVFVSAMAGTTDRLVGYVEGISPMHDAREYDTVVPQPKQPCHIHQCMMPVNMTRLFRLGNK